MPKQTIALPPLNTHWRAEFGSNQTVQRVRPREYKGNLQNPHRGTATFQRFNGDPVEMTGKWSDRYGPETFSPLPERLSNEHYPDTTLAYCRWVWDIFEPRKGAYRWDLVDNALRTAAERGQTLQVRIQPYGGGSRMPEWLTPALSQVDPTTGKYTPEHNHPEYLEHWGGMIRAFGERYDGHPVLESFDVGYGGACGEGGGNCTPDTAAAVVDCYLNAFKKTQLITMLGTPGGVHAFKSRPRIGWRADCFGDLRMGQPNDGLHVPRHLRWNHMYDYYPWKVTTTGVGEAWQTAPITMETCWTVSHWFTQEFDIDFILEQGLAYHTSVFMPKSSYIPQELREKIDAFNRKLGYRFVIRQSVLPIEVSKEFPFKTSFFLENVGVAPIYRDYVLALRFRQEEHYGIVELKPDLRKWLPGQTWVEEEINVPDMLQPGVVGVDVGIIDRVTKKPVVKFAIENTLPDGWHPLAHVDLV